METESKLLGCFLLEIFSLFPGKYYKPSFISYKENNMTCPTFRGVVIVIDSKICENLLQKMK